MAHQALAPPLPILGKGAPCYLLPTHAADQPVQIGGALIFWKNAAGMTTVSAHGVHGSAVLTRQCFEEFFGSFLRGSDAH